jgi:hypothetical protein
VVYLTAPTSATTISVAIGGGSLFLDYTPAPALAAETMSPWTCNVGFSAGGKSRFSDVVPVLADDNTLKIQVRDVWHRALEIYLTIFVFRFRPISYVDKQCVHCVLNLTNATTMQRCIIVVLFKVSNTTSSLFITGHVLCRFMKLLQLTICRLKNV